MWFSENLSFYFSSFAFVHVVIKIMDSGFYVKTSSFYLKPALGYLYHMFIWKSAILMSLQCEEIYTVRRVIPSLSP